MYQDDLPTEEELIAREKKSQKLLLLAIPAVMIFPLLLIGGLLFSKHLAEKPEAESLEAAIKRVGTKLLEKNDCEDGVQGYYLYEKEKYSVIHDEIIVCTNNFNKATDDYPRLLKHEMTHIMQACLGSTINSPDEIRELRKELKGKDEKSYRTIHGAYAENDHFHEVEARWMEFQSTKFVNNQLMKHCMTL